MECVDRLINSNTCTAQYSDIFHEMIRSIFGSFTTVMCGEYNDQTTLCQELGDIPDVKDKTQSKKHSIRGEFESFVFVLLDLLESIENFDAPLN